MISPEYKPDEWEISASRVSLENQLGEGAFGMVFKGRLAISGSISELIAVKVKWQERLIIFLAICVRSRLPSFGLLLSYLLATFVLFAVFDKQRCRLVGHINISDV